MRLKPRRKVTYIAIIFMIYAYTTSYYKPDNNRSEINQPEIHISNVMDNIKISADDNKTSNQANNLYSVIKNNNFAKILLEKYLNKAVNEKYKGKDLMIESARHTKEIQVEDIVKGNGEAIKSGANVTIKYEAFDENNIKFDSGEKQIVIDKEDGLKNGIIGMQKGGKRKIVIPSNLYNITNKSLPAGSIVIYFVELVS